MHFYLQAWYSSQKLVVNFANNVDPNEMQHFAAFLQGQNTVFKDDKKRSSDKKCNILFFNFNLTPLEMYN